jgi:hypothetical protein
MKPRVTTEPVHGFTQYHLGPLRLLPSNTTELWVDWPDGQEERLPVVWKQFLEVSSVTKHKIGQTLPHVQVIHHGVEVLIDIRKLDVRGCDDQGASSEGQDGGLLRS